MPIIVSIPFILAVVILCLMKPNAGRIFLGFFDLVIAMGVITQEFDYTVLYQSKLVPRFIAIWGFIALASLVAARVISVPDLMQGFQPAMVLYFQIVLNELFLAG